MPKIQTDSQTIRQVIRQLKLFMKQENELLSALKTKYKQTGQRWSDLQYQAFYTALLDNEKTVKKTLPLVEDQIRNLQAKLAQLEAYLSDSGQSSNSGSSGGTVSLTDRALFELEVLRDDLELTDGAPDVPQLGGAYGDIRGVIPGFEAHHIPSRAVQDAPAAALPAIAISAQDHALTDSYRGRQNHVFRSQLSGEGDTYRNEAAGLIRDGDYMQLVRFELLNIRDRCGHRYDGAISQYLDALKAYIETNGIPDPVFRHQA